MQGFEQRNYESKTVHKKFTNRKGNWLEQTMPRLYDLYKWEKIKLDEKQYKKYKLTEEEKKRNKEEREKKKEKKKN